MKRKGCESFFSWPWYWLVYMVGRTVTGVTSDVGVSSTYLVLIIVGLVISCDIALRLMSWSLTYDKSTLVQVIAWCCQATSHYLSLCWPRLMSPYGVNRPQWVIVCNVSPVNLSWSKIIYVNSKPFVNNNFKKKKKWDQTPNLLAFCHIACLPSTSPTVHWFY